MNILTDLDPVPGLIIVPVTVLGCCAAKRHALEQHTHKCMAACWLPVEIYFCEGMCIRCILVMQGYLPAAYDYGFAQLEVPGHFHGFVSLQLLGWSVHDVVNSAHGLKTWRKFYQVQ